MKHTCDTSGRSNCQPCMSFQVELWNAINRYATAVGGDPERHVYGNTPRMQAVVEVNQVIARALRPSAEEPLAPESPAPGFSWHDFMRGRTNATPLDAAVAEHNVSVASERCPECARPRLLPKPPVPADAVTYCGECHVPFSLDEIWTLFQEANLRDSNSMRQLRRVLVEDVIEASRRMTAAQKQLQADQDHLQRLYAESRDYVRALERERDDLVSAANRGVAEEDRLDAEVEQLREQLRIAEAVRDDARAASARNLEARRARDAEVEHLRVERDQLLDRLGLLGRGES